MRWAHEVMLEPPIGAATHMADFLEQHRHQIADLCRRFGVRELSLFGSAARGDLAASGDVDVLVEFEPSACTGLIGLQTLHAELETIFRRPVDLATSAILRNPYRRRSILRDLRKIYVA
jgi:predicted nucleotidyltransferase